MNVGAYIKGGEICRNLGFLLYLVWKVCVPDFGGRQCWKWMVELLLFFTSDGGCRTMMQLMASGQENYLMVGPQIGIDKDGVLEFLGV